MNKKGFTLVELISVMVILLVIIVISVHNFIPSYEKNSKKSFLSEALIIAEGARNRYADDRLNNITVQDAFFNTNANSTCYTFESALKNVYVNKYDFMYKGSVEVCHDLDCDYETKVWLTNGEYYLNGVITDNTLSKSDIDDKFDNDYYLTCGVNPVNLTPIYNMDFTGSEVAITIIKDGIYSLETWGAQGGSYSQYRGGYGGYSYNEIELHVGDKLYVNVGGQGTEGKAGYNNAGGTNGNNPMGGGGATSIAAKSGFLSPSVLPDYVYNVAGGGGAATNSNGCWAASWYDGPNAGGGCSQNRWGNVCQTGGNYGKATGAGAGGGFRAAGTGDCGRSNGGSGYIGNPLTRNGVMYGHSVEGFTESYRKTISTTNVSNEPIANYTKKGNGYARIKMISDYFISYNLNGGTVSNPNPTSYSKTGANITLNNPSKDYYTFTGWTGSNGSTPQVNLVIPTGSTGNKTYSANYTPINYSITYNLNGGSLGEGVTNPSTYNIETATFTLNKPTKEGYKFVGWIGSNGTDPQQTVTISKGSTGNKTYTAQFEKIYAVTLDYNISNYTFPSDGTLMDSGLILDFDSDYTFDMNVNLPTSGKRYLLLGNYNTSTQINFEVTTSNQLRVYQSGDKSTSDAVSIGEDARAMLVYNASDKSFTSSYQSASSDVSKGGTLSQGGYSTSTLKLGQDNRGGSTFTGYTLKGLKITSGLVISKLPSSVSLPGSTFAGWYTSPTGGNQYTSASTLSDGLTLYAHWN